MILWPGQQSKSISTRTDELNSPLHFIFRIWENGGRVMAANGALMRTPVIGALLYSDRDALYSSAINIAATTHADPRCLASCTIASALVATVRRTC
jgi:ADP-ribosylglycohydrolase